MHFRKRHRYETLIRRQLNCVDEISQSTIRRFEIHDRRRDIMLDREFYQFILLDIVEIRNDSEIERFRSIRIRNFRS